MIVQDYLLVSGYVLNMVATGGLQTKGFEVTSAETGELALEKMNNSFSFVLMDIGLPGIDGFEVSRQIRNSQKDYANVPIVALTAHEQNIGKIEWAQLNR